MDHPEWKHIHMSQIDLAFEKIGGLVEDFQSNESVYKSAGYSEAQARMDFIDKFWIALGWDVGHDQQTNPYEQEVKVEKGVTTGGTQRRADYAFYLAPNFHEVRFFVEAKKPAVDVESMESYFQLIRYGWNSETPLAVLTDFEQFHILDCRYRPDVETALSRAVAKYHYTDYTNRDKFAEIYWLFSREAVADGSIEKRAKELPKPRGKAVQRGLFPGGYQSIDESFLAELDEYRTSLARTFKNRNPNLDSETLTELAQRTLDRLVFLRFLEDKGIEEQRIVELFGEKGTVWEDFVAASRRLDGIYNGIVYKRHDILDDASFRIDNTAFADICKSFAHINSPYDFNAIPIHILGSIYERFLGKVIVATAKRAKVVEKPEVRKAGGVYYTPEYIVRYIVENTVGKLIEGKTPTQIAKMRFADISCGSGSFLLGIFDVLLKYHGQYYNDNPRRAKKGDCIKRDGKLYLSLSKKREILLNNIYGVDIDAQAVEVCQLSLYLKLLQEETEASTHQYLLDFEHTAQMKQLLPDLSKNIVCGNSLIGRDILDGQLFATDEERKLNPMDFDDAFPDIMKTGGFDAIVGNPPYIRIQTMRETNPIAVTYLTSHYAAAAKGNYDIYVVFAERGLQLLNNKGRLGVILPHKFFNAKYGWALREFIANGKHLSEVVHFGDQQVFDGATTYTCLMFLDKAGTPKCRFVKAHNLEDWRTRSKAEEGNIPATKVAATEWNFVIGRGVSLFDRLSEMPTKLGDVALIFVGLQTSADTVFLFKESQRAPGRLTRVYSKELSDLVEIESELLKPVIRSGCIGRYWANPTAVVLFPYERQNGKPVLIPEDRLKRDFPRTWDYFLSNRGLLSDREHGKFRSTGWYQLYPKNLDVWEQPKIMMPYMITQLAAYYDESNCYFVNVTTGGFGLTLQGQEYSPKYLTALLNSGLLDWFMKRVSTTFHGGYFAANKQFLVQLPIRQIDFSDPADKKYHDEMVAKVEAMLEAKKQLAKAKTDKDKTYYENKCSALDRQIDRLVYDLYDLTAEEIAIVEGTSVT